MLPRKDKEEQDALKKTRSRSKGIVTRLINQVKELMWSLDNLDEVRLKVKELELALRNFRSMHQRYHATLKIEGEIKDSREYYASEERKVIDMLFTIDVWIESATRKLEETLPPNDHDDIRPQDSISNVSTNVSTKHKSKRSEYSRSSSRASARSKEKIEKKAALEAELSTLKMRQAIEIEQLRIKSKYEEDQLFLKQKEIELSLATELAKFNATQSIISSSRSVSSDKISQKSSLAKQPSGDRQPGGDDQISINAHESLMKSKTSLPDNTPRFDDIKSASTPNGIGNDIKKKSQNITPNGNDSTLNPKVPAWEPKDQHLNQTPAKQDCVTTCQHYVNQSENAASRMADLQQLQQFQNTQVQELLKQQKEQTVALTLPQPQIPIFSGDPMEFCNFIRAFENLIEAKTSDSSSRLFYLIQYTEGDVKELMRSCLSMKPIEGYKTARQLLKNKYGQNYKIASACVERVTKTPPIKAEDGPALQRFSVMLTSCKNTLKEIGFINKIENPDSLQKIIEKLPFNLRQRWRDKADEITEVKKREVSIEDIADFVELKARAANHPIFGTIINDSKNQDATKSSKQKPVLQSRRATTYSTQSHADANALPQPTFASTIGSMQSFADDNASIPVFQPKSASTYSTYGEHRKPNETHPSEAAQTKPKLTCYMCDGGHWLSRCEIFRGKTIDERQRFVREKGLCDNCLHSGHVAKHCPKESFCKVSDCKIKYRKHSTYLHPRNDSATATRPPEITEGPKDNTTTKENCSSSKNNYVNVDDSLCTATGAGVMRTGLAIVPVKVRSAENDTVIETYAFLDSGSNTTFCTDRLIDQLGVKGRETTLSLTTMDSENVKSKCKVVSLVVSDLEEVNSVELPTVFTRKRLPVAKEDIPCQEDVNRWPHLSGISLTEIDAGIELLIGNDVPRALEPKEVKASQDGGPYAVRTLLGWTINGPIQASKIPNRKVNRIHVDAELNLQFEQFCNREFNDSHNDTNKSMSQEDIRALRIMKETAKLDDGHYEVGLPWRVYPPDLPNNKVLAERRLSMLKKRLTKDQELHRKYSEFMNTLVEKGYAQCIPEEQLQCTDMPKWYLPHHNVIHPHKPDKVRVVFDCASKFQDTSLNDCLMQGPNLTNTLVGVLTRFRFEQTAVMGDIESMFYQVRVSPEDRTYLRYLWWPDGDLNCEPQEFQMLVHLFGGASSPSCASFGLRKTAEDNIHDFDEQTTNTVNENFYVDDCLTSVESEDKAIELVDQLRKLLSRGGFRLTKWISNSRRVLESVPESERASSVKELDLDHLPTERALGILWNVEQDVFCFKIATKECPLTRRGVLSIISSIYDPLGFVSPVLLPAKELLQELCRQGLGWDDQLSPEHQRRWHSWLKQLHDLQDLVVDRCLKPKNFGTVVSTQLHNFADASQRGYGAVSYLRIVNSKGDIHCSLLMAKSRLTPMKAITIPRLELSAAVVATRLSNMIHQELKTTIDETYFWTDSTCVLGYILNQEKRFHTFVANRIAIIHNGSQTDQWHHIDTSLNPADDASRGLSAKELINNKRWIHGPAFLWKDKGDWPKQIDVLKKVADDDPEVKTESKVATVVTSTDESDAVQRIIEHFSSWYHLKKCIAWILRYRAKLQLAVARRKANSVKTLKETKVSPITVQELQSAEREIISYVQKRTFHDEMSCLASTKAYLKKSSPIFKLSPQISNGILCVGGRLRNASIDDNAKHPIIIPGNHHVSILIARHYHACAGHSGIEHTLSMLRQVFWMVKARVVVRKIINQCFKCRRRQAPPETQRMADLPADRVTCDKPPFTYVGLDCFGPFMVRRARSQVKRYGVIYTCLSIRAIHIEIVHSMEADSFINSLRRFIARRGKPEIIRSDNGTNFVGGNKELTQAAKEWNQEQIHDFLLQREIQWKFNPPAASHQGGVWERCIRTVRKVLSSLLQEQQLDDEGLSTLMCEVESIINSRPITKSSDDPRDAEALTPNHLLLFRPSPNLPPGIFCKDDTYSRRRWRQIQYMSNVFWNRWVKEYLPQLQQRQKWLKPSKNLQVDDIVLVVDEKLPRSSWPLGRVTEVHSNPQDGCVRSLTVKTKNSILVRPVTKIVLLETVHHS